MATKTTAAMTNGHTSGVATVIEVPTIEMAIRPMDIRRAIITVTGDSPLVTHNFGEKAKRLMREKMEGKIQEKKEPKNPPAEYEASKILDAEGRCCVRAIAFKAACVDAASQFDKSLTKVFLRGVFHIPAELLPIIGEPQMREDIVRLSSGLKPVADIRYRAEFFPWKVEVPVRYNAQNITRGQLIDLFRMAGFASGIGEYRPQKDGNWGMFSVESFQELGGE